MRRGVLAAMTALAIGVACSTIPGPRAAAGDTAVVALRDQPETLFAPLATST